MLFLLRCVRKAGTDRGTCHEGELAVGRLRRPAQRELHLGLDEVSTTALEPARLITAGAVEPDSARVSLPL